MEKFINCLQLLENQASDDVRLTILIAYFQALEDDEDNVWACALLLNKVTSRPVSSSALQAWALENQPYPTWLYQSSLKVSGDPGETIALIFPDVYHPSLPSLSVMMKTMGELKTQTTEIKKETVISWWLSANLMQRRFLNKMLTGSLRTNVSPRLLSKVVANIYQLEEDLVYHSLTAEWKPDKVHWKYLISVEEKVNVKAYPFMYAHEWQETMKEDGALEAHMVEYLWKGVRIQVVKRKGNVFIWNKEMEPVTSKYAFLKDVVLWSDDDFVIEGHIVSLPQQAVHKEPTKGKGKKDMKASVQFMTYDVLEYRGRDVRQFALKERRDVLEKMITKMGDLPEIRISPVLHFDSTSQMKEALLNQAIHRYEGFILKQKSSYYEAGRSENWLKLKRMPYDMLAVMIYAQKEVRTGNFNEFTVAVWQENEVTRVLMPVAKVVNSLDEEEKIEITRFIKNQTIERFGPVHRVAPVMIFEVSFTHITESKRNKSNISLASPYLRKWVKTATLEEIARLSELIAYLPK